MNPIIPVFGDLTDSELQHWLTALSKAIPGERFMALADMTAEQKQRATFAIVANPHPSLLQQCPNLIWVQSLWAGVEKLVATFQQTDIKLVRLIDPGLANTMAEAVLTWSLYLHRHMHIYRLQQLNHTWQPLPYVAPEDRIVTLLGLGELGRSAAERLIQQGFQVRGWSRQVKQIQGVHCFHGSEQLQAALDGADIAICLLPLTPQTQGLINTPRLGMLKPGACLINFARGAIVDDQALLAALESGHLAHAVLDVFMTEPLPKDHPYWRHQQVTVLPHISAQTRADTACKVVARNITQYRRDAVIPDAVDFTRGY